MCSNLLEKTSDAVIKAAKNGDLALVSFYLLNSLPVFNIFFISYLIVEGTSFARIFTSID